MRVALAVLIVFVTACSKHETQTITPWLRVKVLRPRADDFIRVGRRAEIFEIKRGGRWRRLGVGNLSRYMVIDEETTVLVDLNDRNGLQLLQENKPPRAIPASFGRIGTVYVPLPSAIDVVAREEPGRTAVYRFDFSGKQLAHFRLSVPAAYSDCTAGEGIVAYGMGDARFPYTTADCKSGSQQAKCLLLDPRGVVHAVPPEGEWSDCANFAKAGIQVTAPVPFTLFE